MRPALVALAGGLLGGLAGCSGDDELIWQSFNSDDDRLQIEIRPGESIGVATSSLTSNTGLVDVGNVRVEPAVAPVGSSHFVSLVVDEEWAPRIDRATITSFGDRGEGDEYDMIGDTARDGVFELELISLGDPDEQRTDVWIVKLWELVEELPVEEP